MPPSSTGTPSSRPSTGSVTSDCSRNPRPDEVLSLFDPEFPYAGAVAAAESIHVHVKVADVDELPHDEIRAQGVTATSCTDGYVKYPFPGGINMIFSSIDISEDDMPGRARRHTDARPQGRRPSERDRRGARTVRRRPRPRRRGGMAARPAGRRRPAGVLLPYGGERQALGVPGGRRGRADPTDRVRVRRARDPRLEDGLRPAPDRPGAPAGRGGEGRAGRLHGLPRARPRATA